MSSFIPVNLAGGTMAALGADKAFMDKTYINEVGDSMKGTLNMGVHRLIVTEPTYPSDAVNKAFLESSIMKNQDVVNTKLNSFEKELRANVKTVWENINTIMDEKIKKEINTMNENLKNEIKVRNENLRNEIKKELDNGIKVLTANLTVLEKKIKVQTDKESVELVEKINKENMIKEIKNEIKSLGKDMVNLKQELKSLTQKNPK